MHSVAAAPLAPPGLIRAAAAQPAGRRRVPIDAAVGFEDAAVYRRAGLAAGRRLGGPAIVEQEDTTVVVPSGWVCTVDAGGVLILEPDKTAVVAP